MTRCGAVKLRTPLSLTGQTLFPSQIATCSERLERDQVRSSEAPHPL